MISATSLTRSAIPHNAECHVIENVIVIHLGSACGLLVAVEAQPCCGINIA